MQLDVCSNGDSHSNVYRSCFGISGSSRLVWHGCENENKGCNKRNTGNGNGRHKHVVRVKST